MIVILPSRRTVVLIFFPGEDLLLSMSLFDNFLISRISPRRSLPSPSDFFAVQMFTLAIDGAGFALELRQETGREEEKEVQRGTNRITEDIKLSSQGIG